MGEKFLSVDLLIEILIRLPVRSLLRFKSVCKFWRALIEAPDFIYRHANFEDESSKFATFIFHNTSTEYDSTYFLLSYNAFDNELIIKDLDVPPPLLEEMRRDDVELVGSCQGLICLADFAQKDVYLWNPATKQIRFLPKPLTPRHPNVVLQNDISYWGQVSYVFGFDVEAMDYKLLMFSSFNPYGIGYRTSRCCYVQVYSLNSDSWRHLDIDLKLTGICCSCTHGRTGRYLNGKYYFAGRTIVWKDDKRFEVQKVLSYDFSKETFKTLRSIDKFGLYGWTLISERVSFIEEVFVVNSGSSLQLSYEVWELDECSGKESWTKRYTIGPFDSMKYFLGISKNGEIAIILTEIAEIINFGTQEIKKVQSGETTFSFECDCYKESLFSV